MTERTLGPEEYDRVQEQQRQQRAEEIYARNAAAMQQNIAEQQGDNVQQFPQQAEHPGAMPPSQHPGLRQPTVQVPVPQVPPTARSFAGGIVAGIVIGGIAMMAIQKAQNVATETGKDE